MQLTLSAVAAQRGRSLLTALGIAVGIASVVMLTSIGEGVHRFVLQEFTQFGTNIIGVAPGKTTTLGLSGAVISNVRPLSMEDAEALERIPRVRAVVPVVQGNGEVEAGERSRRVMIIGVGPDAPEVWRMQVALGRFLPHDDPRAARAFVVLGSKVKDELFAADSPLGKVVRIAGERYRVLGVMAQKGQFLGFDLDDAVYIPTYKALAMFNRDSLMEIDLLYEEDAMADTVRDRVTAILERRHGSEDFTITTQEEMLDILGDVLDILTIAVGAIGAISLVVGAVGILTIMTIAVNERTNEVGLLRAVGARRRQVLLLFLGEAVALSALGGFVGLILGVGGAWLLALAVPGLPVHTPWYYVLLAEGVAVFIGLAAGVAPARNAASMSPVEALRAE